MFSKTNLISKQYVLFQNRKSSVQSKLAGKLKIDKILSPHNRTLLKYWNWLKENVIVVVCYYFRNDEFISVYDKEKGPGGKWDSLIDEPVPKYFPNFLCQFKCLDCLISGNEIKEQTCLILRWFQICDFIFLNFKLKH